MAAYHMSADEVLDWTPRKLRVLTTARGEREREDRIWQINIARIPGLADPSSYIDELIAGLMPWEEYTAATGAPRLDEMSDEQLHRMGVHVDTVEDGEEQPE